MTMRDLHNIWELSSDSWSLLKFSKPYLLVRSAAIFVILLGINGPLLQRALTVEMGSKISSQQQTVPIRAEPVWNLTTVNVNNGNGWSWSTPVYQPEFLEVAMELSQRRPMQLNHDVCKKSATCLGDVVIAAFSRNCNTSTTSVHRLQSIGPAKDAIKLAGHVGATATLRQCPVTSLADMPDEDDPDFDEETFYCRFFDTYFQMSVDQMADKPWGEDDDWAETDYPLLGINYTTYIREDGASKDISIRSCIFAPAFVRVPIVITNGTIVNISRVDTRERNIIETIPPPGRISSAIGIYFVGGFLQTMRDLYEGFVFWDSQETSLVMEGQGPRQYVNRNTIANWSTSLSFLDPLEDFSDTLTELSLRYALRDIPPRPDEFDVWDVPAQVDLREEGLRRLQTKPSKTQVVTLHETEFLAFYKAHFVYAAVAMSVTVVTTLLIGMLLGGWRKLGREVSMSPLEIAKAFDAPLLNGHHRGINTSARADHDEGSDAVALVSSNMTGEQISKVIGSERVRYGEVVVNTTQSSGHDAGDDIRHRPRRLDQPEQSVSATVRPAGTRDGYLSVAPEEDEISHSDSSEKGESGRGNHKLVIGRIESVATPQNGRVYL